MVYLCVGSWGGCVKGQSTIVKKTVIDCAKVKVFSMLRIFL